MILQIVVWEETNFEELVSLTSLLLLKREKQEMSLLAYTSCVDINPLYHFYILSLVDHVECQCYACGVSPSLEVYTQK